mgnify:CR=1 FL=1
MPPSLSLSSHFCDGHRPAFAERLRQDGTAAVAELGYGGRGGEHIVAVFNTPEEHNLIVCTLCSCYPHALIGLPPVWYKSFEYRSRAVREPRAVLLEFGPFATSMEA